MGLKTSNRRSFLRQFGALSVAGAGLAVSACQQKPSENLPNLQALDGNQSKDSDKNENPKHAGSDANTTKNCFADVKYDFYGEHQAGITTPSQRNIYFLVMDLHTNKLDDVKQMFKDWTTYAANLTQGKNIKPYEKNPFVPPTDTGEADSMGAYGLTLTFGISPSFLKKMGLTHKQPKEFQDLPKFPRDQLRENLTGGDICIQACAEDAQVAFHAVRQLVRQARSNITMRWSQSGFVGFDTGNQTPRNLFAFKDGTANQSTIKAADKNLWADAPDWMKGGTYLVTRIIQMHLETWDRTSLKGQEDTFGRHRDSGAAIGQKGEFDTFDVHAKDAQGKAVIPEISHMGLAKRTGVEMLRRSYSYSSGINPATGQFDSGLLFISFQKSPEQFIIIQNALGRLDKMNEYTTHIGSGLFACFGGILQGGYIGQALFEA
ncbi:MAG: deferrochelatase/peroxidase EfeB [Moraxella sp.]|jgi:deferrochelatase/peroxidase EfeB|nr:deferrochelatase/peroxidase EfeB [Moraxella sp.]MBP6484985.1 deferrochelatase/peroxidase EfeB [Moraxella sp.]MBP7234029.1 deferrochelatase/peroxidase EfeB [Moraxella sp.]